MNNRDRIAFGHEPRTNLELAACRAALNAGPPHPTLEHLTFGQMTDAQLREVIAWYTPAAAAIPQPEAQPTASIQHKKDLP